MTTGKKFLFLFTFLMMFWVGGWESAQAAAPARTGQPYAEDRCLVDPDIIFCEDFNFPQNFTYVENCGGGCGTGTWKNPGLVKQTFDYSYGTGGRQINLTSGYGTKSSGLLQSGTQSDYAWVGNWDPTKGRQDNGATWGGLRLPKGNYANGSAPATDFYIRFEYYVTPNYAWPGDPKKDVYNYGSSSSPVDNKILFIYPPEGSGNPTGATYDAGLYTNSSVYDNTYPGSGARFADAIAVRYGNTVDFQYLPMCPACSSYPQYYEYAPFQSYVLRNPHDTPRPGKVFRLDTGKWYTFELHYKLSTLNQKNGMVELSVDGTKIYSQSNMITCGANEVGDCSGLGAVFIGAYHNSADKTVWNGQQVIDNLVISRAPIGLVKTGTTPPPPPAPVDTDGDGIVDTLDKCPTTAGVAPDGCPVVTPPPPVDTDGDGIPDTLDKCPSVVGVSPDGCPVVTLPPPAPAPTIEDRVLSLESTVSAMDTRLKKLEDWKTRFCLAAKSMGGASTTFAQKTWSECQK